MEIAYWMIGAKFCNSRLVGNNKELVNFKIFTHNVEDDSIIQACRMILVGNLNILFWKKNLFYFLRCNYVKKDAEILLRATYDNTDLTKPGR